VENQSWDFQEFLLTPVGCWCLCSATLPAHTTQQRRAALFGKTNKGKNLAF